MEAASLQNQAQLIVDAFIDRMYELVELDRVDCATALHKEIQEWIDEEKQQDIEILSIKVQHQ
jgi:ribosome assembly protein YihI (activator of Der GTPase)